MKRISFMTNRKKVFLINQLKNNADCIKQRVIVTVKEILICLVIN